MKCIYCNNEDTTLSDIVPESLTNAKIARKNVCRITHNNNFGSEFEYDVISKLSFYEITLVLQIKKINILNMMQLLLLMELIIRNKLVTP